MFIFGLFQTNINTILQQINVKNVHPVYGAGIRTHQALEHESPPITTRPGLLHTLALPLVFHTLLFCFYTDTLHMLK